MYLSFETNELSALDLQIVALVAANGVPGTTPPAEEPKVTPLPVKTAPAKKAAPAKAEPAETPAPAPEPEAPAEATPEPEEDLVGAEAPTMADAVAAATKLVSSGGAAKVKEALGTVGAKRVSEIPADSIAAFLDALK